MSKVAGRIERRDLAEIFARAEKIREQRGGGRLGRAMLDELLARAKELQTGPSTRTLKRLTPTPAPAPSPPPEDAPQGEGRRSRAFASDVVEAFSEADLEGSSEELPLAAPAPGEIGEIGEVGEIAVIGEIAELPLAEFHEPLSPPPRPKIDLATSSDELGVLPELPITSDDPRAQPPPAPSLRQLSDLLEQSSSGTAVLDDPDLPTEGSGGLHAILAQATELTFEGYEEELANLLEETYTQYSRGSFQLFEPPPRPEQPKPRRATPLANWRPPPMPDLPPPRPKGASKATPTGTKRAARPASEGSVREPSPRSGRPPANAPGASTPPSAKDTPRARPRRALPEDPFADDPFEQVPAARSAAARSEPDWGSPTLAADPDAGDPFELVSSDPVRDAQQAFREQLDAHGAPGMLERKNPPRGQPASLPIRVVYDPTRRVFGALLDPRFERGDRFQLSDGQVYCVQEGDYHFVGEAPCFQEIRAEPLGALKTPLHKSWEGRFR